jgi:hypothetical protein
MIRSSHLLGVFKLYSNSCAWMSHDIETQRANVCYRIEDAAGKLVPRLARIVGRRTAVAPRLRGLPST